MCPAVPEAAATTACPHGLFGRPLGQLYGAGAERERSGRHSRSESTPYKCPKGCVQEPALTRIQNRKLALSAKHRSKKKTGKTQKNKETGVAFPMFLINFTAAQATKPLNSIEI